MRVTYTEQQHGRKMTTARSKLTGLIIHIDEARNGKDCDCVCLGCGSDVIAYHGQSEKRMHYFGHAPDQQGKPVRQCKQASKIAETLTHELAKQWLRQHKKLTLPVYLEKHSTDPDGCRYQPVELLSENQVTFDHIELEAWHPEQRFRPDCFGYLNNQKYLIEIYVTHKVEEEKLKKIRDSGYPAVEVVLRNIVTDIDLDSISHLMKSPKLIRWLHCPDALTEESQNFAKQQFAHQRQLWLTRQEEDKRNRSRYARRLYLQERAESLADAAIEEAPEQAKEKVIDWKQRKSAHIEHIKSSIAELAQELDDILFIERRLKRRNNRISRSQSVHWQQPSSVAERTILNIDDEVRLFQLDLQKLYQDELETSADCSVQHILYELHISKPPEGDPYWDRVANLYTDEELIRASSFPIIEKPDN